MRQQEPVDPEAPSPDGSLSVGSGPDARSGSAAPDAAGAGTGERLALGAPLPSDAEAWNRLVEEAGPASLLVAIEARMGARLARRASAEDVLQEALLGAWRSRGTARWEGPRAFRGWLLAIALNRLRDLADEASADKRGGGAPTPLFSEARPAPGRGPR
ncbi:MAG: sigma-70 family RNA polymerase sigma factor [Planctomycetota bacterium]